jgi:phospholipase/carboxylesterase
VTIIGRSSALVALPDIGYACAASSPELTTMPQTLSGPSYPPQSGAKPSQLVILLHGLGADGNDLIGLAPYWAVQLPDAEFLSPNAPFRCDMAPSGYQWMSIRDPNPAARLSGAHASAVILDAFIDDELKKRDLTEAELALVGFSQGTMMSLFVGPRRERQLAGIVGYSGRLIAPALLAGEIRSRPPILLVHGTGDPTVPYNSMAVAENALSAAGVSVETLACPGVGHGIDEEGLRRGGQFLHRVLSSSAG